MSESAPWLQDHLQRWPWPALYAWAGGWLLLQVALAVGVPVWLALGLAWLPSLCLVAWVSGRWRRLLALVGLPAELGLQVTVASWPDWLWPALAASLLVLYPLSAWRDAPLFPTPPDALRPLARRLALRDGARLLDAGSGLGHGLVALRRAYPGTRLDGIERSPVLALLSRARRLPDTQVRRGDMWATSWAAYDMVYLFQRPESMEPAWRKACDEMRPGSWLVSLEFPVPGVVATVEVFAGGGRARRVLGYRLAGGGAVAAQPDAAQADNLQTDRFAEDARADGRNASARRVLRKNHG